MRFFLVLCLVLSAQTVFAGGWTSGGGELIRNARNPWFVQNTQSVRYCIEVDETRFSAQKAMIAREIQDAISYWKKEFRSTRTIRWGNFDGEKADNFFQVATQSFIEGNCDKDTDLHFQLGFLTHQQKTRLPDHENFVSLAVRTDYDARALKGRGFIYLKSDKGNEAGPSIWSTGEGATLFTVLVHELGHVFGLPHGGTGLMSEDLPERILRYANIPLEAVFFKRMLNSFFIFDGNVPFFDFCVGQNSGNTASSSIGFQVFNQFTGADASARCRSQSFKNYRYELRQTRKDVIELIGSAQFERSGPAHTEPAVKMYLTPEQQVLIPLEPLKEPMSLVVTERETDVSLIGIFKSANGKIKRTMTYIARPGGTGTFGGILDGRLYTDLNSTGKKN